ncbi:MAG TPA: hypothetical protein VN900_04660 [Stellaceae bacterium]|jgi:hypothetical protein|nr:hypothetical protein [Stellaceae bacterium]
MEIAVAKTSVLIVGVEPSLIDFSDPAYGASGLTCSILTPGVTPGYITDAISPRIRVVSGGDGRLSAAGDFAYEERNEHLAGR